MPKGQNGEELVITGNRRLTYYNTIVYIEVVTIQQFEHHASIHVKLGHISRVAECYATMMMMMMMVINRQYGDVQMARAPFLERNRQPRSEYILFTTDDDMFILRFNE